MRLSLGVAVLSVLSAVNAAYFSEGWKPGQPPPTKGVLGSKQTAVPVASFLKPQTPVEAPPKKSIFELATELQTLAQDALLAPLKAGPVAGLIQKATGLNISQAIEKAKMAKAEDRWDPRIALITDDNWEEIVEYEQLTPEEEDSRTWLILVTLPESNQITQFVEEQFVKAFNQTMENGNDLPDVRWARIDYYNVTELTTNWMVWKAPVIVIATHRGKDLRFFHPTQIKMRELHGIMKEEVWKSVPPWKSAWAPGGEKAWILHHLGIWLRKYNDVAGKLPKWILMMGTGMLGSFVIQLLHRGGKKKDDAVVKKDGTAAKPVAAPAAGPSTPSTPAGKTTATPESKKEASKRNRAAKRTAD